MVTAADRRAASTARGDDEDGHGAAPGTGTGANQSSPLPGCCLADAGEVEKDEACVWERGKRVGLCHESKKRGVEERKERSSRRRRDRKRKRNLSQRTALPRRRRRSLCGGVSR